MAIRYKGFNTVDQYKKFRTTDLDLVKRDLLNHFSIRKGEKLMQPDFGSIIWNMLFEPMTPDVEAVIVADVKRVVQYDPRVSITGVIIDELDVGIQVQIDLVFLPDNLADRLTLNFDSTTRTLTTL